MLRLIDVHSGQGLWGIYVKHYMDLIVLLVKDADNILGKDLPPVGLE